MASETWSQILSVMSCQCAALIYKVALRTRVPLTNRLGGKEEVARRKRSVNTVGLDHLEKLR